MKDNMYIMREVNRIMLLAREEAERLGNENIRPDHLFLAILRDGNNRAYRTLKSLDADTKEIKLELDSIYRVVPAPPYDEEIPLPASVEAQNVLGKMISEAKKENTEKVDSLHLLCAILGSKESRAKDILEKQGISLEDIVRNAGLPENLPAGNRAKPDEGQQLHEGQRPNERRQAPARPVSMLQEFGTDLTSEAESGRLDPVIGREEEIERLIRILGRRKKNNPLLIGDSGVGKSAIVEGLAAKIAGHRVPKNFIGKRIISLDMPSVVAGTKFRGEFEERLKSIINELSRRQDIILFIDEIHTIIGAGSASGSIDAANMLKPALARGEIQCIGATTREEFTKTVEKDAALERRFQKIPVEPTDFDGTLAILKGIKGKYEDYHGVVYTEEAMRECIRLTERYINGRALPDKAIDAMDEAGSMLHLSATGTDSKALRLYNKLASIKSEKQQAAKSGDFIKAAALFRKERSMNEQLSGTGEPEKNGKMTVTADHIAAVVSEMSGIPVEKIAESEAEKLSSLSDRIKRRIIGQDEAVDSVANAIKRSRSGLKDPGKPIGTFIFFGPTGVGKTELAKAVAEGIFGSQDSLIRVDMGEFSEKFTSSRLIGAPPGYVGYDNGGELSEKVRKHPYSVVLLDEIEKAHPDIFNMLLQIMDEGKLTDSNGRSIDFRNCIIIMTSNAGSREMQDFGDGLGFLSGEEKKNAGRKSAAEKAIRNIFPPEFLNRIDVQVHFNPLTKNDMLKIADIELSKLKRRMKENGYVLEISEGVKRLIAEKGYDPKFGARPLKRAIQNLIENPAADEIIRIKTGQAGSSERRKIVFRLSRGTSEKKIEIV